MFKNLLIVLLCLAGSTCNADQIIGVICSVEKVQPCAQMAGLELTDCFDTPCDVAIVNEVAVPRCPTTAEGCVALPNDYSGYRAADLGEQGFPSFTLVNPRPCQACGMCKGCGPVSGNCMDDAGNWPPTGAIYYDLVGVGNCNGIGELP